MTILLSFILATIVVSLMPGPSMILIIITALEHGLGKAMQATLGAVLADAILLALALCGLGAIIHASALAFQALKWIGVLYLIYLGAMQLRSKVAQEDMPSPAPGHAFLQGLGVTLLNPKIIGFLIVFFPQFIKPQAPLLPQLLILAPLFLLVVFLVFAAFALAARGARRFLGSTRGKRIFKNLSGCSLIGCGIFSATV
ncbi:LysE family translocator [Massilia sp. BJB1822]|uniref:LysE family translocator n=1 Tax=Massilia sp. BJB1822 TaxID=2744470 RepID=UPI001594A4A4|nr:LysE family translocator [Massilia sp. BJB1822]NVE00915.1 LysE family translocator [Massilia sp. BJB1822]